MSPISETVLCRFGCITSCFKNIFSSSRSHSATVHLFLSLEEAETFKTIAQFLKRCASKIPEKMAKIQETLKVLEVKKKIETGAPLCTNMLTRICPGADIGKCTFRHFLSREKLTEILFSIGFNFVYVGNIIVYFVKLDQF